MYRILYQRDKCIGCGACVEIDKWRWRVSRKNGKSVLIGSKKRGAVHQLAADAEEYRLFMKVMNACPVKIIKSTKIK